MPDFFDQHADIYEQGGFAGGNAMKYAGPLMANSGMSVAPPVYANQGDAANAFAAGGNAGPMSPEGQPQAQPQNQNVGHDGTYNGMNREQYRDAWMSSGVDSVAGMQQWLAKNGGTMTAANGTVMTPYGESLDMGGNAKGSAAGRGKLITAWGGGGAPAPAGGPGDGAAMPTGIPNAFSGGGGGFGGSGGGGARPSYNGPDFAAQNIDLPTDYNPAAIGGPQNYTPERVSSPDALHAQQIAGAEKFGGVTAADMEADPGYQFRLKTTLDALQNSAGARGLLRSTNTAQGLMDTAGQMASQEYGNVYGRKSDEYKTGLQDRYNVGTANNAANAQAYDLSNRYQQGAETTNAGNALNAWHAYQGMRQNTDQFNATRTDVANQNNFANRFSVQNANNANSLAGWQANTNAKLGFGNLDLGYTQAGNAFSLGQGQLALGNKSADQSYDLGMRNNALGYTQAGNAFSLGQGQQSLGWANYGLNADQQNFNQGYSLADMGMRAAGQQGAYAGAYANNAGNYATQAGNANAAGRVGSANAWNQGFQGAYNAGANYYANQDQGNQ